MAANGVTGSCNRRLAPWEVRFSCADNALSWRLFLKRPIGIGGWRCYNMVNADQINAVRVTVFNQFHKTEFPFSRSPWLNCIAIRPHYKRWENAEIRSRSEENISKNKSRRILARFKRRGPSISLQEQRLKM